MWWLSKRLVFWQRRGRNGALSLCRLSMTFALLGGAETGERSQKAALCRLCVRPSIRNGEVMYSSL